MWLSLGTFPANMNDASSVRLKFGKSAKNGFAKRKFGKINFVSGLLLV